MQQIENNEIERKKNCTSTLRTRKQKKRILFIKVDTVDLFSLYPRAHYYSFPSSRSPSSSSSFECEYIKQKAKAVLYTD